MELRHLRYFVAVAEEQNVTRAAARLHVSQPPLTRQIRDLEDELGVALFHRDGKTIRLTEAGRVFLDEARAALARVEAAVAAVRAATAGRAGELHVGYAPSPTIGILSIVLSAFRKTAPGVRVTLHDASSPEMLAGLRDGRLHAAFMVQPSKQAAHGVVFERLRTYPVVVAVSPGHPFARRRAVSLEQALAQPLVAYSRKEYPDYHELLARVTQGATRRIHFAEECDSGSSLITAIESGKGVAITMASLVAAAGKRLRFVRLLPEPPPAAVGLAFRRGSLTPLARQLVETVRNAFEPQT